MSFSQFYQDGGVWMHVIALLTMVATGAMFGEARQTRSLAHQAIVSSRSRLVPRLAVAVLLVGGFAVLDGFTQVVDAAMTVAADQRDLAVLRGLQIAITPGQFALAAAALLMLAHGVLEHARTRGIREPNLPVSPQAR